ncbi:OsmC-like protein, partial [Cutibacterium avidum TM16]
DTVRSRRGGPTQFTVSVMGTKVSDEEGRASLGDVSVDFQLSFPDTDEGHEAAGLVNRVVAMSRDKNCTVSRTVEAQTPVTFSVAGEPLN